MILPSVNVREDIWHFLRPTAYTKGRQSHYAVSDDKLQGDKEKRAQRAHFSLFASILHD